jgi:hypothetical protein
MKSTQSHQNAMMSGWKLGRAVKMIFSYLQKGHRIILLAPEAVAQLRDSPALVDQLATRPRHKSKAAKTKPGKNPMAQNGKQYWPKLAKWLE